MSEGPTHDLVTTPEQPLQVMPMVPMELLSMAVQRGADVGTLERLAALAEAFDKKRAKKEFDEAMLKVQAVLPPVVKDARNQSTNSSYAKLENIQAVVTPIAVANGFTLSFGTDQSPLPGHYGVTCIVAHSGGPLGVGHERLYRCDVPIDNVGPKGLPNKTATHGFGSSLSYGERYLIKLIFNIRLIGEDDDGQGGREPKQKGPSSLQPATKDLKELAQALWNVLKPVRGAEPNWHAANQWMWDEGIISDTEAAPNLTPERFKTATEKAKEKLKA
ncbi:MAG: ERF family protein [Verrucomicrobiales bacterium]|nr:ERF family protein [Verrucomicrobiales bacterium]